MFQQGEISRADFLRIELQTLQFQTDLDDATLELNTAKAALRGMLGKAALPGDFDLAGELKADPFDKDLAELKMLALQNRPDLKSAQIGRDKAAADLRLAQANRWPDPTIGASYLHTGSEVPGPHWFQPFYPKGSSSNAMGVGIASIPIPIFNRNQGEVARAQSEQLRAGLLADSAEIQVVQDVESAYANFVSARERLRMYEDTYLGTGDSSVRLAEDIGLESVGLNPDIGNLIRLHRPVESWVELVQKTMPWANFWHVKNYQRDEEVERDLYVSVPASLESGLMNYRWALDYAVSVGFQGAICTENYGGDGLSVCATNRDYLRRHALPKRADYELGTSRVAQHELSASRAKAKNGEQP